MGWLHKTTGMRVVRVNGFEATAARMAWFYMTGAWPQEEVIRANGDAGDDRWANLELSSRWFKATLTQERLKVFLHYEPATGVFTWLRSHKYPAGTEAGYINDQGYRLIYVSGRDYRAHHLAWLYVHGCLPKELDHKNGNPADNRIHNLREATRSQNLGNTKKPRTNKSGYKGVSWHADGQFWQVHIKHNGVNHYLGHFDCPKKGHEAYCEAANRLRGEFARTD